MSSGETIARLLCCSQSPRVPTLPVEELKDWKKLWEVMMQQFHEDAAISLQYAKKVPGARPALSNAYCSLLY